MVDGVREVVAILLKLLLDGSEHLLSHFLGTIFSALLRDGLHKLVELGRDVRRKLVAEWVYSFLLIIGVALERLGALDSIIFVLSG